MAVVVVPVVSLCIMSCTIVPNRPLSRVAQESQERDNVFQISRNPKESHLRYTAKLDGSYSGVEVVGQRHFQGRSGIYSRGKGRLAVCVSAFGVGVD